MTLAISDVDKRVAATSADVGKLSTKIDSLVGRIDGAVAKIDGIEELGQRMIRLEQSGAKLHQAFAASQSAIDALKQRVEKLSEPPKAEPPKAKPQPEKPKPAETVKQPKDDGLPKSSMTQPESIDRDFLPTERYSLASDAAKRDGRPLLVIVTADWCTPCKQVHEWLPQLRRKGHVACVNLDREQAFANQLTGPGSIPRMAVFTCQNGDRSRWTKAVYVSTTEIHAYAFSTKRAEPEKPQVGGQVPEGFSYASKDGQSADVLKSKVNASLCSFAQSHANYQAEADKQGHQNFDQRRQQMLNSIGPGDYREICAESWPRQAEDPPAELWAEMFDCWRQSPGHWSVASRKHSEYGSGMARSRRGVWYACIITRDIQQPEPSAVDCREPNDWEPMPQTNDGYFHPRQRRR
ncbi:MAG: thioredoxin family protein [Opitutaceae bacterium]